MILTTCGWKNFGSWGIICPCDCMHAKLLQLCLTLFDPMNCSRPGSSVHGILQTRILEWVPIPSSVHVIMWLQIYFLRNTLGPLPNGKRMAFFQAIALLDPLILWKNVSELPWFSKQLLISSKIISILLVSCQRNDFKFSTTYCSSKVQVKEVLFIEDNLKDK